MQRLRGRSSSTLSLSPVTPERPRGESGVHRAACSGEWMPARRAGCRRRVAGMTTRGSDADRTRAANTSAGREQSRVVRERLDVLDLDPAGVAVAVVDDNVPVLRLGDA